MDCRLVWLDRCTFSLIHLFNLQIDDTDSDFTIMFYGHLGYEHHLLHPSCWWETWWQMPLWFLLLYLPQTYLWPKHLPKETIMSLIQIRLVDTNVFCWLMTNWFGMIIKLSMGNNMIFECNLMLISTSKFFKDSKLNCTNPYGKCNL